MTTLEIKDLHVSVENPSDGGDIAILNGVNLTVSSGETHAVMGPNGSGKSTLSYAIAGHPKYRVTSGSITLDGEDVLEFAIVALRPEMTVGLRIDQLQVDVHLLAGLLHAAFEDVGHSQLFADIAQIVRCTLVFLSGRARNDF